MGTSRSRRCSVSAAEARRIYEQLVAKLDIRGKDVLVVEDIVDTGRTMAALRRYFEERGAASVRFCVLIDKKERREVDSAADYVGFEVESGFLVGYGLDCREQDRHCPEVYRLLNL